MDVRKFVIIIAFLGMQQSFYILSDNKVDTWFSGAGDKIENAFKSKKVGEDAGYVIASAAGLLLILNLMSVVIRKIAANRGSLKSSLFANSFSLKDRVTWKKLIKDTLKKPFDPLDGIYKSIKMITKPVKSIEDINEFKQSELRLGTIRKVLTQRLINVFKCG